jgi:hypothetical protein
MASKLVPVGKISCIWREPNGQYNIRCEIYHHCCGYQFKLIYVLIYFSLRREQRHISQQSRSRNRALQEEFVKTIMIVAFIEIITLVPTSVYALIYRWSDDFSVVNLIFFEMYLINFVELCNIYISIE